MLKLASHRTESRISLTPPPVTGFVSDVVVEVVVAVSADDGRSSNDVAASMRSVFGLSFFERNMLFIVQRGDSPLVWIRVATDYGHDAASVAAAAVD